MHDWSRQPQALHKNLSGLSSIKPSLQACSQSCYKGLFTKDQDQGQDLGAKDQDQDKDFTLKDKDKDKDQDLSVKDQDKDKDLSKCSHISVNIPGI